MNSNTCGCKGVRSCLICENPRVCANKVPELSVGKTKCSLVYCWKCGNRAWEGWNVTEVLSSHPNHHRFRSVCFEGVEVVPEFVSVQEEDDLVKCIDNGPWVASQSGRIKQDFGPRVNFKKKKVRLGDFRGFPNYVDSLLEKFAKSSILKDFRAVELCNLDYHSDRGASIDPHADDSWLWGNRLVTLNLLSDSVLTLSYPRTKPEVVGSTVVQKFGCTHPCCVDDLLKETDDNEKSDAFWDVVVRVPLPKRSCIVLSDNPRYHWDHSVLRCDVTGRRIAMTFRELTPSFLEGGEMETVGTELLKIANLRINNK